MCCHDTNHVSFSGTDQQQQQQQQQQPGLNTAAMVGNWRGMAPAVSMMTAGVTMNKSLNVGPGLLGMGLMCFSPYLPFCQILIKDPPNAL